MSDSLSFFLFRELSLPPFSFSVSLCCFLLPRSGKIADCCERAYDSLPVASFASMLSIQPAELQGMCAAEKVFAFVYI
jgi:hypothetical protein